MHLRAGFEITNVLHRDLDLVLGGCRRAGPAGVLLTPVLVRGRFRGASWSSGRSKEPVYTEEKTDAVFLASAENSKEADKKTSNVQTTHGGSHLQQPVLIAMLSIGLVQL